MILAPRDAFLRQVTTAVRRQTPYAAGKIGTSEKTWMYYPVALARGMAPRQRVAFEASLKFHALHQSGVFPDDPAFLLEFARVYVEAVRTLDCLGLFLDRPAIEEAVVRFHGLDQMFVRFEHQEPDRSVPDDPSNCYLPALEGRRLLLVSPFADLLQTRATRGTFEAVWSRTGKRWFAPASVDSLEFPYGVSPATWRRYPTALDLHADICREMARREFDVALVAAGGLGIPIAAAARRMGKVAISLGGHLQVTFGVLGQRWRQRRDFDVYLNDAWIDMPARYRPDAEILADRGAYW